MNARHEFAPVFSLNVQAIDRVVQLLGQGRRGVSISDDLDVGAGAAGFRLLDDVVKFAARGHARGQPAVTTQRPGELMVVPLGEVVVIAFRILAEQPLDQIPVVVEYKDNRLYPEAMKLTD